MEPIEYLDGALAVAVDKIGAVVPGDFSEPTPCAEFDVESLLNHILIVLRMLSTGAETGVAEQFEFGMDPKYETRLVEGRTVAWLVGDDPVADCVAEVERVRGAWHEPGVMQKQIKWGPWGTMSAAAAAFVGFRELLLHAWDVAKATGQDTTLPDDLAAECLRAMTPHDAMMRAPKGFASKVDLPADASVTDRLVAFAGRQP